MIVAGVTDRNQIKAALNVTEPTLQKDLTWIYEQWNEQDRERAAVLKNLRTEQLEDTMRKAMVGYTRSTEEQKEVAVTTVPERCGICHGLGTIGEDHDWCEHCEGSGKVMVESNKVTSKTKPGDVGFLSEARKCIQELIKMEGHHAPKAAVVAVDITEQKIHTHKIAGQAIPADLLLDAMEVLTKIENAQKKAAIEAVSEEVDEDNV